MCTYVHVYLSTVRLCYGTCVCTYMHADLSMFVRLYMCTFGHVCINIYIFAAYVMCMCVSV